MLTSKYEDIYQRFLDKITDYDIIKFNEEDVNEYLRIKLHSVLQRPYIFRLFSSLDINDSLTELSFEVKTSTGYDQVDLNFIEDLLARSMVIEWLEPKVKSTTNIYQMFGGKEANFYSQATHIGKITEMLATEKRDVRRMLVDSGFSYNSYLKKD